MSAAPVLYKPLPAPTAKESSQQSIALPDTKAPGHTAHYRNSKWTDLKGDYAPTTLPKLFESGLAQARDLPFLGHRQVTSTEPLTFANEYTWQTYGQVDKRRRAVGSAIDALFKSGKLPAGPDFEGVGIWALNRPEWQIVDLACHAYKKVSVALYDSLGPQSVEYVINHSELPIVFCSSKNIESLLKTATNCPVLKMIISLDPLDAATKAKHVEAGKEKGVEVKELKEIEEEGEKNPIDPIDFEPDQIAIICYTSGTSGTPKGVVMTHGNMSSAALAYLHGLPELPKNFIMLSYLPLAHSYGRCFELTLAAIGGCVGYYSGNPLKLMEDAQILKPHVFPAVPRVLNRIYQTVMANVHAPGVKGFLFRQAVSTKLSNLRTSGTTKHSIWDKLVFKKVQAALGGRVCLISSGSAPINPDTFDFLKISFACQVVEGYGLTESCAVCAKTLVDDPSATGTIGGLAMVNEVKLVDVPELDYKADDKPNPRGELCIRGANVFSRYYKDDKTTREAIDADGWFHTGDVAEIDSHGRFKIIDRVKNIMKLSQGEYVALEKIENVYTSCAVVAQIYIHGESTKDHLVAIVVPDPLALSFIAADAGHKFDPSATPAVEAAIKEPAVVKAVLDSMTAQVKKSGGLKGFEVVKAIHLTLDQFTVENGTLTPTFKIRRRDAYAMHKAEIDALYGSA
ncbi:hypothetical protein FRB99_000265 [Tulasnella sp. 403]|nr:hypothetical protein FRB99_000265 [Tulasnella sp. 403]